MFFPSCEDVELSLTLYLKTLSFVFHPGALAVHSILEMMALGLADSFGDCALLTLSIALHQVSFLFLTSGASTFALFEADIFCWTIFFAACRIDCPACCFFEVGNAQKPNNSVPFHF